LISCDTSTTSLMVGWKARSVWPRLLAACKGQHGTQQMHCYCCSKGLATPTWRTTCRAAASPPFLGGEGDHMHRCCWCWNGRWCWCCTCCCWCWSW
jgi:hypothetical protein